MSFWTDITSESDSDITICPLTFPISTISGFLVLFLVGISPSSTSLLICNRSPSAELRPLKDTASLSSPFLSFLPVAPKSASLELTLDSLLLDLWSAEFSFSAGMSRLFSTGLKASLAKSSSANSESDISSIPEACGGGVLSVESFVEVGIGMPLRAEVAASIPEADTPGAKAPINWVTWAVSSCVGVDRSSLASSVSGGGVASEASGGGVASEAI